MNSLIARMKDALEAGIYQMQQCPLEEDKEFNAALAEMIAVCAEVDSWQSAAENAGWLQVTDTEGATYFRNKDDKSFASDWFALCEEQGIST